MADSLADMPTVYRLLADAHNTAADATLLRALPTLRPPFLGHALDTLLKRGRPAALVEFVASFAEWPEDAQREVTSRAVAFETALRLAMGHASAASRLGAVEIVVRGDDTRLAYLLNEALVKPCPETRARAGEGLRSLAERFLEQRALAPGGDLPFELRADERHLVAAAERALRTWSVHHRLEAVAVAAWLVDKTAGVILEMLDRPRMALFRAFNALMSERPDERLAPYTLWALSVPQLRDAAAGLIARCEHSGFLAALIEASWRLGGVALRQRLVRVRDLVWSRRTLDPLRGMQGWRARSAVRFLASTGIETETKVALLTRLADTGNQAVAAAALAQLAHLDSHVARAALGRLAGRPDHPLANAAGRILRKRGPAVGAALFPWSTARSAEKEEEAVSEQATNRSAHDPDPRVRSRAMTLLGRTMTPTAALLLPRALHDADFRVQANAIEALDGLNVERLEALVSAKLDSPNSRVRANAVKALLRRRARKAGHALLEMLASAQPEARLSALWVAERMSLNSLLDRIEDVAATDPDAQVRERAARLAARLARPSRVASTPAPAGASTP